MAKLPEVLLAHFVDRDDFCYPDWKNIIEYTKANFPEDLLKDTWREVTLTWLDRIQKKLGAHYYIYETPHFFILVNPKDKPVREYAKFVEKARDSIHKILQDAAWKGGHGKHVVLVFDEVMDYYRYLSPFYTDGEHPATGGVFLSRTGYRHIAVPYDKDSFLCTLAHEYTHNWLVHFPLPSWLNEAMAMRFESVLAGAQRAQLDHEACDKHYAHWNQNTIQEFWSGKSWAISGEGFSLSYDLAKILFLKIETDVRPAPDKLAAFIKNANRRDAGEAAAQEHLELSLADLAADFLGEGDWLPRPADWKKKEDAVKVDEKTS